MRPTSDMVRESLFNIVGDLMPGRLVIDLFAGTGALGLEALSRGAARAIFVEKDRENVGADPSQHRDPPLPGPRPGRLADAYRWGAASSRPSRNPIAVFLDPPYREYEIHRAADEPDDRVACWRSCRPGR